MMAAIAVLALVFGGAAEAIRLKRLRVEYQKIAAEHSRGEALYRRMEQDSIDRAQFSEALMESRKVLSEIKSRRRSPGFAMPEIGEMSQPAAEFLAHDKEIAEKETAEAAHHHEAALYHAELRQKYVAAAARPWRSIEPDPLLPAPPTQALYWSERGDHKQTIAAYREALKRDPEDEVALNGLAWVLATCPDASFRDGKTAVEAANRACEWSNWTDAACLDTLAAAYAEIGDFRSAVRWQREAIAKLSRGDLNRPGFFDRLQLYESNEPYRDDGQKWN